MKRIITAAVMAMICQAFADYSVTFEGTGETKASYASGNVTLSGINWNMTEALIGTSASDYKIDLRSARLNGLTASAITMLADKSGGLGTLSFYYCRYGTDGQVAWRVEYSTDGGSAWTQIGSDFTPGSSAIQFSQAVNVSGNVRLRIRAANTGIINSRRANIDNILLTDYATPSIALADNGTQVTAGNVVQGTTAQILHKFQLGVTVANATLTAVSFPSAGTYSESDLSNFKVWYSTDNTLNTGSDTLLGTISTGLAAGTHIVSSLSQAISSGNTGYIFITADIAAGATVGNTINVNAVTTSDVTFSSGTKSGSTTLGGTQTITASSTPTISAGSLSAFGNQAVNTTSGEKSYTVAGANLTANIIITPPVGFEISTTSGSGFVANPSTLTLTQSGGTVNNTTIYVRFKPTAVQSYSAYITHTSTGATQVDTAVSGAGTAPAEPTLSANAASAIQINLTIGPNANNNNVIVVWNSSGTFTTPSGVPPSLGGSLGGGTLLVNGTGTSYGHSELTPATLYYYKAWSYDSVGNFYSAAGVTANATTQTLPAPTANAAEAIGNNTFFASWSTVSGASNYRLDVYAQVDATDLFISEYVEGTSNNKYLEIYNGTGASVDLSNYSVLIYANGSATPTATISLSGTLANNNVYVIKNSTATAWSGTANLSTASLNFNGNDALALHKSGSNIDVMGTIGVDVDWGLNTTLQRKASVDSPTTTFTGGEWDVYAVDTVSGLGSHTYNGFSYVTGYNNKQVSGTSEEVLGLTQNSDYYYKVRAYSATSTSPDSNIIGPIRTAPEPGVLALAGLLLVALRKR